MKKLVLLFLFGFIISFSIKAQEGYHYLNFRAGKTLKNSVQLAVGLEFNSRYFRSVEIEFEATLKENLDDEESYIVNMLYEPVLIRNSDFLCNFRIGGLIGSQQQEFALGLIAGLELSYALPGNIKIMALTNSQFLHSANPTIRHGVSVGLKLPF